MILYRFALALLFLLLLSSPLVLRSSFSDALRFGFFVRCLFGLGFCLALRRLLGFFGLGFRVFGRVPGFDYLEK